MSPRPYGRDLVVAAFVTLDGVMQAPGGPDEDTSTGFRHGGWSVALWDDAIGERIAADLSGPFDLLLGRKTYEIFAAHWPHAAGDPVADRLNAATKHVASRTLDRVEWSNSTLLGADVVATWARLRDEAGPELQVHGSWCLVQTLLQHDLVDEFRLVVFPVVLGDGKRLFEGGAIPAALRLVDSATAPNGALFLRYRRAGAVVTGSFALADR